jgi:hypothetical protein
MYIKENILKNRNVDVFIQSWDITLESKILEKYAPFVKKSIFEVQKKFDEEIKAHQIDENIFEIPEGTRPLSNSLSFFYSRKRVINLKQQHEKEQGFKYDIVIVCRFDLGQIDKYNGYQFYKASEIRFNENFDMNYIYSAMHNQMNGGYGDQWFYSNSKNIDLLATMYDKAYEYFQPDSRYISALVEGWPDSSSKNIFCNEFFKSEEFKSKDKVVCGQRKALNNHFMHKWFFIDNGLYKESRFV